MMTNLFNQIIKIEIVLILIYCSFVSNLFAVDSKIDKEISITNQTNLFQGNYSDNDIEALFIMIHESLNTGDHANAFNHIEDILNEHRFGRYQDRWVVHEITEILNGFTKEVQSLWNVHWQDAIEFSLSSQSCDPLILIKAFFTNHQTALWDRLLLNCHEDNQVVNLAFLFHFSEILGKNPQLVINILKKLYSENAINAPTSYWLSKVIKKSISDENRKIDDTKRSALNKQVRFKGFPNPNTAWEKTRNIYLGKNKSLINPVLFPKKITPKIFKNTVKALELNDHYFELTSYDLELGRELWNHQFMRSQFGKCYFYESITFDNRQVDVLSWKHPSNKNQYITNLICRDEMGILIWEKEFSTYFKDGQVIPGGKPHAFQNQIIIPIYDLEGAHDQGGFVEYSLLSLDLITGDVSWKLPLNSLELAAQHSFSFSEGLVEGEVLFLATGFNRVLAIDLKQKIALWEVDSQKKKFRDIRDLSEKSRVTTVVQGNVTGHANRFSDGFLKSLDSSLIVRHHFSNKVTWFSKFDGSWQATHFLPRGKLLEIEGESLLFGCPGKFLSVKRNIYGKLIVEEFIADLPSVLQDVSIWEGGVIASSREQLFYVPRSGNKRALLLDSFKPSGFIFNSDSLIRYSSTSLSKHEILGDLNYFIKEPLSLVRGKLSKNLWIRLNKDKLFPSVVEMMAKNNFKELNDSSMKIIVSELLTYSREASIDEFNRSLDSLQKCISHPWVNRFVTSLKGYKNVGKETFEFERWKITTQALVAYGNHLKDQFKKVYVDSWNERSKKGSPDWKYSREIQTKNQWNFSLKESVLVSVKEKLWKNLLNDDFGYFKGTVIKRAEDYFITIEGKKLFQYKVVNGKIGSSSWGYKLRDEVVDDPFTFLLPTKNKFPKLNFFGSLILVGEGSLLSALNARTGQLLWSQEFANEVLVSKIIFSKKMFYVPTFDKNSNIIKIACLQRFTGEIIWAKQLNFDYSDTFSEISLIESANQLTLFSGNSITKINKESPNKIVRSNIESGNSLKKYLGGSYNLAFRSNSNKFLVYSPSNNLIETFNSRGDVLYQNDFVYFVGSIQNKLFAYDLKRNKLSQSWALPAVGDCLKLIVKGDDIYLLLNVLKSPINSLIQAKISTGNVKEINSKSGPNISLLIDGGNFVLAKGIENHLFLYED